MKLVVCSVFDDKAKAYLQPFFVANENIARRSFGDAVADPSTGISKHVSDYKLYQVGIFDDNSGMFDAKFDKPVFLANAIDFVPVKGVSDEKN